MTCDHVERNDLIERYLDGKLTGAERQDFEQHYFECEECFAQMEAARAARQVLKERGFKEHGLKDRGFRPKPSIWVPAAIAAAIVIAFLWPRPKPQETVDIRPAARRPLLALNEIQPAPYSSDVRRGTDNEARRAFRMAMEPYLRKDWTGAIASLDAVIARFPDQADAIYFRAIAQLLSGNTAASVDGLTRIANLGSSTPYEEEARFYLAQALLVSGRDDDARAEIDRVIALDGDYEVRAEALKTRLGQPR